MNNYRKLSGADQTRLHTWWQSLDKNRGERAQLRRASSPDDVLLTPAFAGFLREMPENWGVTSGEQGVRISDAAMVAAILARVKENKESGSFATALAQPKKSGEKAAMSELRFQQLQRSRTEQEFFMRICRALALLKNKVNIISLADDVLHWLTEFRCAPATHPGKRLAVKWASEYYAAYRD